MFNQELIIVICDNKIMVAMSAILIIYWSKDSGEQSISVYQTVTVTNNLCLLFHLSNTKIWGVT